VSIVDMNIIFWGILLGVMLLLLAVCVVAWWQLARRLRAIAEAQQQFASTDVPTSMLVTAMARVEARLPQLEHEHQIAPAPQAQPDDRAFDLAQRMARNGADAAQIAEACGINLHEAELLRRLHAPAG
jgi:HAMP domain-containing protein